MTSTPTIGVLAGWSYYWTSRPRSYLNPIDRGIRQAAADLRCNLLVGCGMGPSAASTDPLGLAWLTVSPDSDSVPIGPWNTAGLIAVNPLHAGARSHYLRDLVVARLTSASAEFLSMRSFMPAGRQPYSVSGGEFCLE